MHQRMVNPPASMQNSPPYFVQIMHFLLRFLIDLMRFDIICVKSHHHIILEALRIEWWFKRYKSANMSWKLNLKASNTESQIFKFLHLRIRGGGGTL